MADSPMERAVRALSPAWAGGAPPTLRTSEQVRRVLGDLARLRTSDPDAFDAVLAECGVTVWSDEPDSDDDGWGTYPVSEGQAVIEGRVVDLEPSGWVLCEGRTATGNPLCAFVADHQPLYRVKPERSASPSDRHTEDAS